MSLGESDACAASEARSSNSCERQICVTKRSSEDSVFDGIRLE